MNNPFLIIIDCEKTFVWAVLFSSLYTCSPVYWQPYKHMDFREKLNGPAHALHSTHALLTGYISKLRQSIYALEGLKFHNLPELSVE